MRALMCPLCRGEVAVTSSGCLACHLPLRDVMRHQRSASRGRALARGLSVRVTGVVLYSAAVVWCAYALPGALPFVVPGAVLGGGVLHAWKGRPWLGLILFTLIVVVVPFLVAPAFGIGTISDVTGRL